MTYFSNSYLNKAQMTVNAQWILNRLLKEGWSKNAICGLLGNMESESTMNAGLWEKGKKQEANPLRWGYGLTQWTPASKYVNWCKSVGIPHASMESNILRILYEVRQNIQWINSLDPKKRTFRQWTRSTDSPYELAMVFIRAYERPKYPDQPNRGRQAKWYFDNLTGGASGTPIFEGTIMEHYLNLDKANHYISSKYGMRFHPIEKRNKMHAGEDVACRISKSPETPVPSESKVLWAGNSRTTAGNWVVYHPLGSDYMVGIFHFDKVHVSKNQHIQAGTSVGVMGSSGGVTGRHWHIEVRKLSTTNYWGAKHYNPNSIKFKLSDGGSTGISQSTLEQIVQKYLGIPYLYGGKTMAGLDCSGFTYLVFQELGVDIGHGTQTQMNACQGITYRSEQDLKIGDLLFYGRSPSTIDHVAIYMGNGRRVHSSSPRVPLGYDNRINGWDGRPIQRVRRCDIGDVGTDGTGSDQTQIDQYNHDSLIHLYLTNAVRNWG